MNKWISILWVYTCGCFALFAQENQPLRQSIDFGSKVFLTPKTKIAEGVYKTSYRLSNPALEVFYVEVDLQSPNVKVQTCLPGDTLYGKRATVMQMSEQFTTPENKVVAAINTDFFQFNDGKCASSFVVNGQVGQLYPYSKIYADFGPLMGITHDRKAYAGARVYFNSDNSKVYTGLGYKKLNGVNTINEFGLGDHILLYTPLYGASTKTDNSCTELVLGLLPGQTWMMNGKVECEIKEIYANSGNNRLKENEVILSGFGEYARLFSTYKVGRKIGVHIAVEMEEEPGVTPQFVQLFGSNTLALKNGEPVTILSGAGSPFSNNPRSGVGYSQDRTKLYLCVVDGRSARSVGVTVPQLGQIMKEMGAMDVLNCDGGGSSMIVADGAIFNNPSESRQVAQGLIVLSGQQSASIPSTPSVGETRAWIDRSTLRLQVSPEGKLPIEWIDLYGMDGKRCQSGKESSSIDFSRVERGVYFIRLTLADGSSDSCKVVY